MKNYPFIKFCLLFITGIFFQHIANIDFIVLLPLLVAVIIFTAVLNFSNHFAKLELAKTAFVFITVFLFGALVLSNENISHNYLPISIQSEKEVKIFGKISNVEIEREYEVRFDVEIDSFKAVSKDFGGSVKVICRIRDTKHKLDSLYSNLYPGYKIEVTGKFRKAQVGGNPGEYDANSSLHNIGVSSYFNSYSVNNLKIIEKKKNLFSSYVFEIRKNIDKSINKLYSKNSAGLIKGFIIADRSGIEPEVNDAFINSGVVHVLSVSGLHIAYILLILLILFSGLGIRLKAVLTIITLVLFAFITGSPVAVLRSIVIVVVLLIAFVTNRNSNNFNSLSIAAFVILLINPNQLFDIGFQLSFCAAISIALFHPIIKEKLLTATIKPKWVKSIIYFTLISLAAQLGTLPFVLTYFHKLPLVALAANLFIVPITGIIITNGVVSIIFSLVSLHLASIFAASNEFFIYILYKVLFIAGDPNYSFIMVREFSWINVLLYYLFFIIAFLIFRKNYSVKVKFICLILIISNYYTFTKLVSKELMPNGKLDVAMINVGQGDCFLLKFPTGKTAIIDGGNASYYWDNGEKVIFPILNYLDIKTIDYAFVSHIDKDHYSGLVYLIEKGFIKNVFKPKLDSANINDVKFENFLKNKKIRVNYYSQGIVKVDNSRIYFYNLSTFRKDANSNNDNSGVFKIVYGKTGMLFTGDISKKAESILSRKWGSALKADILKVSHHGSKYSTSENFLTNVAPVYSLISVGISNIYKHPSIEVIERLNKNSKVLRTDKEGAIFLTSDGENIKRIIWR